MNSKPKFANRVVIITGASRGIGKETALAFAREGAITILSSRSKDKLELVADEVRKFNPNVRVIPVDVSSQAQVQALVSAVVEEFSRVDVLINNAGSAATGNIESSNFVKDVRELFEIDYLGKVYCAQAVLPLMRQQGNGFIVNLSSVVGRKAFPGFAAYSTAMHAVSAFSDALRQELEGTGIQVATVHPALTQTSFFEGFAQEEIPASFRYMTPLPAAIVANKILKTVLNKKARCIIPWQPRLVILGDSLSANLGDLVVRLLKNRIFMRSIGMYKGSAYQLSNPQKSNVSENPASSRS